MARGSRPSVRTRGTLLCGLAVVGLLIGPGGARAHPASAPAAPHTAAAPPATPPVVERITATVAAGRSVIVAVPDQSDGGYESVAAPVRGLSITHALYTPPATTTTTNGHTAPVLGVSAISLFTITARARGHYTVHIVQRQPFGHNPPTAQEVVLLTFL